MSEIPEYYKWRCKECREEPKHQVFVKGKLVNVGGCKCNGSRVFEMVPLTKQMYERRLS